MTLGMAWVRQIGRTKEFVVAVDSRLSGGEAWDGCPKLLTLPRSDCVIAFSGNTHHAYPLMLQIQNAINMHRNSRDRTIDIIHMKGHLSRVWKEMSSAISSLPMGQDKPDPRDVTFLFGGYSWREHDFRFWKITGSSTDFQAKLPDRWGPNRDSLRIVFFGDVEPIAAAKKLLAKLMIARKKLPGGDFDMEPFEVLRDIIRANQFHSVGGPPQLVKIYQHMNTVPFALYWPNSADGRPTLLGRTLLDYEVAAWPILDPDKLEFKPSDSPRSNFEIEVHDNGLD